MIWKSLIIIIIISIIIIIIIFTILLLSAVFRLWSSATALSDDFFVCFRNHGVPLVDSEFR